MSYESPLAYLLGLEGLALLRGFIGEFDREFTEARIAEVRALLADPALTAGVDVGLVDTVEGYRLWSASYDSPNVAFDIDEPIVTGILDSLPVGTALDAACGTGRYAALLAARGHRVIGVDGSPDMLALARSRAPDVEFHSGQLTDLPLADTSVDLVVCALALTHVADLAPVVAEFARVLRPGGHLVLSDIHPERVLHGSIPNVRRADGEPARVATYRHLVGDYLRAALAAGLTPLRCEEPPVPPADPAPEPRADTGPWKLWPWTLAEMVPEAGRVTLGAGPALLIWQFRRD